MLKSTQKIIIESRIQKYDKILTNWYNKEKPEDIKGPEATFTKNLSIIVGGRLEVRCSYGLIDLLTDDLVIEAKKASTHSNKSAIGQALVYNRYFPTHTPAIALIGNPFDYHISQFCSDLEIIYFFYWNNIWQIAPLV